MNSDDLFEQAAKAIKNSHCLIALTGAGISVESGIPDFRSPGGLWEQFDPYEYAHIDSFKKRPAKVWQMVFSLRELTDKSRPNAAHISLAKLEEMGLLKAVITQNIDNMHQEGGSKNVIEFHGNAKHLQCLKCDREYSSEEIQLTDEPPVCPKCRIILKPAFIFFGEMIPPKALTESMQLASSTDVIIVAGTSAVVQPASTIPYRAKQSGATVIEMNLEETGLTNYITDIFLQGNLGETLPKLVSLVEKL